MRRASFEKPRTPEAGFFLSYASSLRRQLRYKPWRACFGRAPFFRADLFDCRCAEPPSLLGLQARTRHCTRNSARARSKSEPRLNSIPSASSCLTNSSSRSAASAARNVKCEPSILASLNITNHIEPMDRFFGSTMKTVGRVPLRGEHCGHGMKDCRPRVEPMAAPRVRHPRVCRRS